MYILFSILFVFARLTFKFRKLGSLHSLASCNSSKHLLVDLHFCMLFKLPGRGLHSRMPFAGNHKILIKLKRSVSNIWEHPLPRPVSVPPFRTGYFPSGRETLGIPKRFPNIRFEAAHSTYLHGTLAEMTRNDLNVMHKHGPCFNAPPFVD